MEPIELLKQLYKEKFNIDEVLVELMADRDILHLTASGSSIYSISRFLDIDIKEIKKVNKSFYGFEGWEKDLDLNPFNLYQNMRRRGQNDFNIFRGEIALISPYMTEKIAEEVFDVCCKFYTIEKLIEEEWN